MDNEITITVKAKNDTKAGFDSVRSDAGRLGDDSGDKFGKSFASRIQSTSSQIGPKLAKTISDGISSAGEIMPQILGGAAVAAAPFVGATISAAIIGGASIGAAGIGVALAAQDPRVHDAGVQLGKTLMAALRQDADVFVGPILTQISKISVAFDQEQSKIKNIFANSAGFLDPLVDGALGAFDKILSGIDDLVANGRPVIDALSSGFEKIGGAIGQAFSEISTQSESAASAIDSLSTSVAGVITSAGDLITFLSEVYGWFSKINDKVKEFTGGEGIAHLIDVLGPLKDLLGPIVDKLHDFGDAGSNGTTWVDPAADAINNLGGAASAAAPTLEDLTKSLEDAAGASNTLYSANTNVEAAMDNFTAAIKKNGSNLDGHTTKSRLSRTAAANLASALNSQYEAFVAVNGVGEQADAVQDKNYSSFIKTARGAGLSAKAARDLAHDVGVIPSKKDTKFNTDTGAAAAKIRALQAQINALKGKTVTIHTVITGGSLAGGIHVSGPGGSGTLTKAAGGVAGHAAEGGAHGDLTLVGEQGPELVDLAPGSGVSTAGDTMRRMASGPGVGSGPNNLVVSVAPGQEQGLMAALLRSLRFEVRAQGGNVQTVLGT